MDLYCYIYIRVSLVLVNVVLTSSYVWLNRKHAIKLCFTFLVSVAELFYKVIMTRGNLFVSGNEKQYKAVRL